MGREAVRVRAYDQNKRHVRAGAIGPQGIGTVQCAAHRSIGVEVAAVAASGKASAAWTQEWAETLCYRPLARTPAVRQRNDLAENQVNRYTASGPEGRVQDINDAFVAMMADIYAPIFNGGYEGAYPSFADGVRGMEILAAVLKSAAEHRWIAIGAN